MNYNKRQYTKVNDKKVLHKVRKQWVTISVAMLGMLGLGVGTAYTSASASADDDQSLEQHITDNFAKARRQAVSQPMQHTANGRHMNAYNPKNIEKQADLMTQHLMRLSAIGGPNPSLEDEQSGSSQSQTGTHHDSTDGSTPQPNQGQSGDNQQNSGGNGSNSQGTPNQNNEGNNPSGQQNHNQNHSGNSNPSNQPTKQSLTAKIWVGPKGNRQEIALNGLSDTQIVAQNGKSYQLKSDKHGNVHIYAYSDTSDKYDLTSYLENQRLGSPVSPTKYDSDYVTSPVAFTKYTITPHIKINHAINNNSDFGDLDKYNGNNHSDIPAAKPITLYGFPGDYVKVPYSDILVNVKSGKSKELCAVNQLGNYHYLCSDQTLSDKDSDLENNDNQLRILDDTNDHQYTPYIQNDTNTNIIFNGNDNFDHQNYLTYQLNPNGSVTLISGSHENYLDLNYRPPVSSDLSITVYFEDSKGQKHQVNWTAKPQAPIYAPNGQVYQLFGTTNGTQVFKYSDKDHQHALATAGSTTPINTTNNGSGNINVNSDDFAPQLFTFKPKLHFIDTSDGKNSDFTVNAIPVSIEGYKGEYVKIPYNDIYANVHTHGINSSLQKITDPSTFSNYVLDGQSDKQKMSNYIKSDFVDFTNRYGGLLQAPTLYSSQTSPNSNNSSKAVSGSSDTNILLTNKDLSNKSRNYLIVKLDGNEVNAPATSSKSSTSSNKDSKKNEATDTTNGTDKKSSTTNTSNTTNPTNSTNSTTNSTTGTNEGDSNNPAGTVTPNHTTSGTNGNDSTSTNSTDTNNGEDKGGSNTQTSPQTHHDSTNPNKDSGTDSNDGKGKSKSKSGSSKSNQGQMVYNVTPIGFNKDGSLDKNANVITLHYHEDHVKIQYEIVSDDKEGNLTVIKKTLDGPIVSGPANANIPYQDSKNSKIFSNTLINNYRLSPKNYEFVPVAPTSANNIYEGVDSPDVENSNNSGHPSWSNPRIVKYKIIDRAHHADQPMKMIIAPDSDENPQPNQSGVGVVTSNLQGFIGHSDLPVFSDLNDLGSLNLSIKNHHDTPYHDNRKNSDFYDQIREWINNRNNDLANSSNSPYQEHDEIELPTMQGLTFKVASDNKGGSKAYWEPDTTNALYSNYADGTTKIDGQMVPVIRYRRMVQVNQTLPVEIASDKQQQTDAHGNEYTDKATKNNKHDRPFDKGSIHVQFPQFPTPNTDPYSDPTNYDELEFNDGERTSDTNQDFIPLEELEKGLKKGRYNPLNAYKHMTNQAISDSDPSAHDSDQFRNWPAFTKTVFALELNNKLNPNWQGASSYDESSAVQCSGYSNARNPYDSLNWDFKNNMPILRYVSKVQDQFPVILKDQNGNVTYASISDATAYPSDTKFNLSFTGINASDFHWQGGQQLPSNSDFTLCTGSDSSDHSKYKMISADLSNPNQLAMMGTGGNHTGYWIVPGSEKDMPKNTNTNAGSDTKNGSTWIDNKNWVPYSDWTKGMVGNRNPVTEGPAWASNYGHKIPVLYYHSRQHFNVPAPQVLVASDYQKSGYKLATLDNFNVSDSFIPISTLSDGAPESAHIIGLKSNVGKSSSNGSYFDVPCSINSDNLSDPSDRSGLAGHHLDYSDQNPAGYDNPNDPTLRIWFTGDPTKVSDITNSKNWKTAWVFKPNSSADSDKNLDTWDTINWDHNDSGDGIGISDNNNSSNNGSSNKNKSTQNQPSNKSSNTKGSTQNSSNNGSSNTKGSIPKLSNKNNKNGSGQKPSNKISSDITTGYPVVRYVPKVTEDFKVWLGSDNQTSHYTPAIIRITSDARSTNNLASLITDNDQHNNYELLDMNGHPLSSDDYKFSDSNVFYKMSSDKLSDRENDNAYLDPSAKGNIGDVNPVDNHLKAGGYHTFTPYNPNGGNDSDSTSYYGTPNWSNDPIKKDNWADGAKIPVLRRSHQRTVYLPIAFAPDPIYYDDKNGNPVYPTKNGNLNKSDYIMGKVNVNNTSDTQYSPEATHGKNRPNQADDQPNKAYSKHSISLDLNNITWDQSQLPTGTILDVNSVNYILNHLPNYIPGSPDISASDKLNQIAHWDNFIQHMSQDKNTKGIKQYSMTIGGNTVPGYEIDLNNQSDNKTSEKTIDSWIDENWPDPDILNDSDVNSNLDTPLVRQLKNGKVFVGIPVIRYMPVYQTPQMYQLERYYTPSVQAMQQHPSDFAQYYNDNNMTGPNGLVNTINPNNNDWQNYLNVPYHLNNGDNDEGNSTWINKSQGASAPWLYNRNYGYQNGYFTNSGVKTSNQSVIGNLLPMRNSDINAKDFNTTMGNDPHDTEVVEVTAGGQPKLIDHLSDANNSSNTFTFDLNNGFTEPQAKSDKSRGESIINDSDTVDGVKGINLYDYTNNGSITVLKSKGIKNNRTVSDTVYESLNNVGSDTLFYPDGVNPIYVKTADGALFPCPFISGHYYTPSISGNSADYSSLKPVDYTVNPNTLQPNSDNNDNYHGMYKLPDNNHITHIKNYDIKFLSSTSQLNSSDLPEATPIFETHVMAPEGSEFHFHGDHLVLYETDPLGRTFPVAYLHQSSMTPSDISHNNSLLYKMNVPSDKFRVGSDWQSDSLNRTYNHFAGFAFDDTYADDMSDGNGKNVPMKKAMTGNRVPEDVEKALYNWRTTDNFTFDPHDPEPDNQGFYNSDFVYSNTLYNDNRGNSSDSDYNPDFHNYSQDSTVNDKLQYHSNNTFGASYLDGSNGKQINSTETQDIPLYVHPKSDKLVQINVNYFNILDGYKLDALSTNVLQPNDAPNFDIASYIPTYVSKNGDYIIDKTYNAKFSDPSYPHAKFKYVVSGDAPHYYNGVNTITANIYLSPISAADPNFYKQFLGLHIKYVDADNGKPFTYNSDKASPLYGKPLSDFIWDVKPKKASDINSYKDNNGKIDYNNNPYVLVDKSDVWTNTSKNPNHITGSDGNQHPYELSINDASDGKYKRVPVSFTESDGTVVKSDMRTLPSLNWVMKYRPQIDHYYNSNNSDYYTSDISGRSSKDGKTNKPSTIASDLHWLNLLTSTDPKRWVSDGNWIPVRVDYFDNVLDTNNKTKANTTIKNGNVSDVPIFQDHGFPSDIAQGAGNLKILYDKLGSAFLQGTIVIALHKPEAQAKTGYIRFVDEDNFKDENNDPHANSDNTTSDNVGAHYLASDKWNIPLINNNGSDVSGSTISDTLSNELNSLYNHGLEVDSDKPGSSDGRVYRRDPNNYSKNRKTWTNLSDVNVSQYQSDPDEYHYDLKDNKPIMLQRNRKITLSDFGDKDSVYTIFLRHRPRIKAYPKLNIVQHVLANFVYSDGQGHDYDVPDSDVPFSYQGKGKTKPWYQPDKNRLLYQAQWFNHDQPNVVSYVPLLASDAYDGQLTEKSNTNNSNNSNSNSSNDSDVTVHRVHNEFTNPTNYAQIGNYIVDTPVSDQIGGFTNNQVMASLIFAYSGNTILDNILSPFLHYNKQGTKEVTSDTEPYDSDANISDGNNDMAVFPPYRVDPTNALNTNTHIKEFLNDLASNTDFSPKGSTNAIYGLNDSKINWSSLKKAAESSDPKDNLQAFFTELDDDEVRHPKQTLAILDHDGLTKNVYQVFTYKITPAIHPIIVHYHDAVTGKDLPQYDFRYDPTSSDQPVSDQTGKSDTVHSDTVTFKLPYITGGAIPNQDNGRDDPLDPVELSDSKLGQPDSNSRLIPQGYIWVGYNTNNSDGSYNPTVGSQRITDKNDLINDILGKIINESTPTQNGHIGQFNGNQFNGTFRPYKTISNSKGGKVLDQPDVINVYLAKTKNANETVHFELNGQPSPDVPKDIDNRAATPGINNNGWQSDKFPKVITIHGLHYKSQIVSQPGDAQINSHDVHSPGYDVIPGYSDASDKSTSEFYGKHYDPNDGQYSVHYVINYVPYKMANENIRFEINGKAVTSNTKLSNDLSYMKNGITRHANDVSDKNNWDPYDPKIITINGVQYSPQIVPAKSHNGPSDDGTIPGFNSDASNGNDYEYNSNYYSGIDKTKGAQVYNVNYVINYTPVPQPVTPPTTVEHGSEVVHFEINGQSVPAGSVSDLPSDVSRSDTSSDVNQGWLPVNVPQTIKVNGKTYVAAIIAEPNDAQIANGYVPGYQDNSDNGNGEFSPSHTVPGTNGLNHHVEYIINYVPAKVPAKAKIVVIKGHHKKTYIIHGDQGTPINYKKYIPKHERYRFGKHDVVIINKHTNVIYIVPKRQHSKVTIRIPKQDRITRRIVNIHRVPYLIVQRGKLVIRKVRLTSPHVHEVTTPRHKLPQTNETHVHASVWATILASISAIMVGLGRAIGFKKHRE